MKAVGNLNNTDQESTAEEDYVEGCFKENYLVPHICPVATGGWCKSYTKCKSMEGYNNETNII